MTKTELESLVREAYAMWSKDLFETDRPHVCRAWWALLQDMPYEETRKILANICLVEKFLPTPGAIRIAYEKTRIKNPPPTPHEFWAHLQTLIKNQNSGTHQTNPTKISEHEITKNTLQELGATALTLTTNGDREYALACFNNHYKKWITENFTVEETP